MPYLITVKRQEPWRGHRTPSIKVISRRAVRTLEEAHSEAWRKTGFDGPSSDAVRDSIGKTGGSISGKDGTRIEVEPVSWARLLTGSQTNSEAAILEAFNARNG